MLVMGTATGEALAYVNGYNVSQPPSSVSAEVSAEDQSRWAEAEGIKANATGEYTIPDTITRVEATATGLEQAYSYGVRSWSNNGDPLTVHLGSLDISSKAVVKGGEDYNESFGIFSFNNSTVTMNEGSITSSMELQTGSGAAYGIFSGGNSHVTSGADSITVISKSMGNDAFSDSVGVRFGSVIYDDDYEITGYTQDTVTLTSEKVKIDVTSIAQADGSDPAAYGIQGIGGEISLNDAEITVQTRADHQTGYNSAYGIGLDGSSALKMKDGFIHVSATDTKGETFTGAAVGIQTVSSKNNNHNISLGTVDILVKGVEASGLDLAYARMDMAGGRVEAESHGGQAQALNANSGTTFTASGDIDFTARAENSKAVALRAESGASITALGGAVTASGDRTTYDSVGAVGLEAHNGGVITKTGGDVTVSSATGTAIGLDAIDNSFVGESHASRITYGNADTVTQVTVNGVNAYGVRAGKESNTRDGQLSSVELTNGDIKAISSGGKSYGAYSVSGNIALKGTTAITASAGTSGGEAYSLYATSIDGESSAINVERASTIAGDMATATNSASVTASFQDGGKLKGWTRSLGTLELTFGKSAVWEMVSSNKLEKASDGKYAANLTKLALDGSHVYVGSTQGQWEAGSGFALSQTVLSQTDAPAELKIEDLSGSGDFYLRTDMQQDISDSIKVTNSLSGTHTLHVAAGGTEPVQTQTQSYLARTEAAVSANASAFTLGNPGNKVELGVYNYVLANRDAEGATEWYLTRGTNGDGTPDYSPTTESVLAMASSGAQNALYQNNLMDLRKRLGEVRDGVKDGLWASFAGWQDVLSGYAGSRFRQEVYSVSLGLDRAVNDNWLVGANFRATLSDQKTHGHEDRHASGDADSQGLNLYATWNHGNGTYADFVASVDRYGQEITTNMLEGEKVKGKYHNWGYGLSAEVGRKFAGLGNDRTWFVEPQAQLSWYHVRGDSFSMDNGMRVKQGNADSLTARVGVVAGRDLKLEGNRKGQYYLKMGVNHELSGDQKVSLNDIRFEEHEIMGTRFYYGVGMDWELNRNTKVYGQIEREDGGRYTKEFEFRVGLKRAF